MMDQALEFLRNDTNAHFRNIAHDPSAPTEDRSPFPKSDKTDQGIFQLGAVTLALINVEQEHTLRAANPYQRSQADGAAYQVRPDIRINLCVLFVARLVAYADSLAQLSRIISYYQSRPVLDEQTAPLLPPAISRLTLELITLPLSEQKELWTALNCVLQPSLLYRVRMLVFEDQQMTMTRPIRTSTIKLVNASVAAT